LTILQGSLPTEPRPRHLARSGIQNIAHLWRNLQAAPLHTSMRLLREFAPVNGVDHAVHAHEQFGLWVLRVNALGNGHNSDTCERETFEEIQSIGKAPCETGGVITTIPGISFEIEIAA
jgi:hypothetical protein